MANLVNLITDSGDEFLHNPRGPAQAAVNISPKTNISAYQSMKYFVSEVFFQRKNRGVSELTLGPAVPEVCCHL